MPQQIVYFLKKAQGHISGEELSHKFKISRAGIWKYIEELRRLGYDIVAIPHLGYRLLSVPDKLLSWEIDFELGTKIIGREIVCRGVVSSTMDEALQLAIQGVKEGMVVCAEGQTKGRGRLGRNWVSPKGKGIYLSIILRPAVSPQEVSRLTLLSAVAVCEAIMKITGIAVQIKWPNDLLVNNRKLGGILTELNAEMDRVKFVIVGIGINVNTSSHQLPPLATSLKQEAKRNFSRIEMIQEILRSFEKWYVAFPSEKFLNILERWKELSVTLGKRIRIVDPQGMIEGEAFDLDKDGGLLIRSDAGTILKKLSGDVLEVR